jgi:toxin ParE1/3/4
LIPFTQASARNDILDQDLPDVADRFLLAVKQAIDAVVGMPEAGAPKPVGNPQLDGLRTWLVHGFDDFRVYYLARANILTVIRVLHGKRDIGSILETQPVDTPNPR